MYIEEKNPLPFSNILISFDLSNPNHRIHLSKYNYLTYLYVAIYVSYKTPIIYNNNIVICVNSPTTVVGVMYYQYCISIDCHRVYI